MADEFSIGLNLRCTNGAFKDQFGSSAKYAQLVSGFFSEIVTVTTSAADVALPGLATLGFLILQNLDPTNYVDVGIDATGLQALIRLLPGDPPMFFRLKPGVTLMAQAHTASCKMLVKVFNA